MTNELKVLVVNADATTKTLLGLQDGDVLNVVEGKAGEHDVYYALPTSIRSPYSLATLTPILHHEVEVIGVADEPETEVLTTGKLHSFWKFLKAMFNK